MSRCLVILLLGLCVVITPARCLSYVESSQGLIPPIMEGGRTEIEFADVDDDGNADLVSIGDHGSPYINTDQHGIMVWFGDGEGSWSVYMTGNFGYGGIAIGDVDGDRLWDAAYGMHHNYASNDFGDQLIEAALGDGTGRNWIPWDDGLASAGEEWGMFGTDLADVDNDGDLDIGSNSFGCCSGVHIYENHGDGTWTHLWGLAGGNSSMDFLFRDINADGSVDFASANSSGTVYLGDGQGGFTNVDGNLPPGGGSIRVGLALGDVDNDGDLDISFGVYGGSLEVWLYVGVGVWANASEGLPTSGISATQLADMNGDGWLDVVALGSNALRVWLGDGGSTWSLAATIPLPSPAHLSALRVGGDIDHNGLPDIAVVSEEGSWPSYQNYLRVFREATLPLSLDVRFVGPWGGEKLVGGSVRFIDWISEVPGDLPALIDLDLSVDGPAGPWVEVASGLPDGGRYQWWVPVVEETSNAYLRVRATVGEQTTEAITPRPFTILPPTAASAGQPAAVSREEARAFPNPTDGLVRLVFPEGAESDRIRIFDVGGSLVRTLPAATPLWDGMDAESRRCPPGTYYARCRDATAPVILTR